MVWVIPTPLFSLTQGGISLCILLSRYTSYRTPYANTLLISSPLIILKSQSRVPQQHRTSLSNLFSKGHPQSPLASEIFQLPSSKRNGECLRLDLGYLDDIFKLRMLDCFEFESARCHSNRW